MWPTMLPRTSSDTVLLQLYCAWGTGLHRESLRKVMANPNVSRRVIGDWRLFLKANFLIPGIASPIFDMAKGKLQAWDVECFLYMLEHDLFVLYPKNSLVKNIGFDGTGLHCGIDTVFEQQKINESTPVNVDPIKLEEAILCKGLAFKAFGGWKALL